MVLQRSPVDAPAEAVDLLIARDDVDAAAARLDAWRPHPGDLRGHRSSSSCGPYPFSGRRGTAPAARAMLFDAAARAESDVLLAPVLDAPHVLGLLRSGIPTQQFPRLRARLLRPGVLDDRESARGRLIDPLTERELAVLIYLPTRLSNAEIAAEMYVSVNTLKTHLRNVYRKLDVADRDAAVARAGGLGLL